MTFSIVVARYMENIEWTKQYPNVIIYNKGPKLQEGFNEITLKNVGREGHTYYTHICNNYDNLDDYIIFLQGNPYDHSPNLHIRLLEILNMPDHGVSFEYLSRWIINCKLSGCIYHPGLPMREIYKILFNEDKEDMDFHFGAGAQFIVSKQNILKRPKEFYEKIVELLDNDINPIEGPVIERFHNIIFN